MTPEKGDGGELSGRLGEVANRYRGRRKFTTREWSILVKDGAKMGGQKIGHYEDI